MKKHLKTSLLCCLLPFIGFGQDAFEQAKTLIQYEKIISNKQLPAIVDVYIAETAFTEEHRTEIENIVAFTKNPFGVQLDYAAFSLGSLVILDKAMLANRQRKNQVEDYELAQECRANLPENKEDFWADERVFFSESDFACYQQKYLEKHDSASFPTAETYTAKTNSRSPVYSPSVALSVPTKVVDATSQFLVLRVKEELLLAFFDGFLEDIRDSKELTFLLPNTYFLLENNDIFKAPSMGAAWVTAFEEDLEQLPQHLEQLLIATPEYAELRDAPSTQMFLLANRIYQRIDAGGDVDVWQFLEEHYEQFSDSDFYLVQLLGLADLIQENLEIQGTNYWYDEADVDVLLRSSKNAALLFTGLLYQQKRELFKKLKVPIKGQKVPLVDLLQGDAANFVRSMSGLLQAGSQLNLDFQQIRRYEPSRFEEPDMYRNAAINLAHGFFDFLDETVALIHFKDPTAFLDSDYTRLYKPLAFQSLQTLDAAFAKDYGKLLVHSTQLMQPIIEARIVNLDRKLVGLPDVEQKRIRKEIKQLNDFIKSYLYYGGFIVDILSAATTEEVHFIIDKYAAPVQSYRVNRQSDFSINIGAYPGLYSGYELSSDVLESSFVTGVTAPIGLSLGWGKQKMGFRKPESSVSLFLPIIDIGAPFSYRWQNDSEGFPANLTWRQVLSPGAYLVWGLGDTPLALKLGAQYTPELRKVTTRSLEFQTNAWRIGATIAVDIPVFYLKR